MYSGLEAPKFYLAELGTENRSWQFQWKFLARYASEVHFQLSATSCHLQSLSLTVPREVPSGFRNYLYCQELSEAFSSDKGWGWESLTLSQSGPCSMWQKPHPPPLREAPLLHTTESRAGPGGAPVMFSLCFLLSHPDP